MEGVNNDNQGLIRVTVEWMRENYDRFNQELFGGTLGDCSFEVFTTGAGSQGRTLGRFKLLNKKIKANRYNRRMFFKDYFGDTTNIDRRNFVTLCRPCIEMNGNYMATDEALCSTLVHEMVHYCDYMSGYCPKQAHGPNFRSIASTISARSGGRFTIQRLATAEEMKNYQLDSEIEEKNKRRLEAKKSRACAIIVYKKNGAVELTIVSSSNDGVPRAIYNYYTDDRRSGDVDKIIKSNDSGLIDLLYEMGYRRLLRTWKYWNIGDKPWVDKIKDYQYETLYSGDSVNEQTEKGMKIERDLIREIVEDVISSYNDDAVQVGGVDLGLESPLENV